MKQPTAFQLTIRGEKRHFSAPIVMGILNVTPDSFFEGSRKQTEHEIAERCHQILDEGGLMIDVGACSTRPGSAPASQEEEMSRLRHALAIIRRECPDAIVSVDTFRSDVACMAVEEYGADIINDVDEGSLIPIAARLHVPYILMSTRPTLAEMVPALTEEVRQLRSLGCDDIILDPGYGFGKTIVQNYDILHQQESLLSFELPLLVGVSRKRMVWQLLESSPNEALNGTTVVNTIALLHGANILRVHDVRQAVETVKITTISSLC